MTLTSVVVIALVYLLYASVFLGPSLVAVWAYMAYRKRGSAKTRKRILILSLLLIVAAALHIAGIQYATHRSSITSEGPPEER